MYADGANLNALLGLAKLGDLGFDICHSNLHKTFSTPHGGGGPGAGPVMVTEELAEFLPAPVVNLSDGAYRLARPDKSIGKINGFHGSFSILVRAYTYMRSLGRGGLRDVAENAIINANYVQAGLRDRFDLAADRYCMHETVLSARRQKARGAGALDIAKRLLDYGIHAPTMYFPLIVDEALMIEPDRDGVEGDARPSGRGDAPNPTKRSTKTCRCYTTLRTTCRIHGWTRPPRLAGPTCSWRPEE